MSPASTGYQAPTVTVSSSLPKRKLDGSVLIVAVVSGEGENAKAAVIGLTKALARGFGDDNIRVNAIEPGAVMTEKQRQMWYKTEDSVEAIVNRQAIKRVLLGEEIARLVLFLAAEDSAMLTKQSIILDAGLS